MTTASTSRNPYRLNQGTALLDESNTKDDPAAGDNLYAYVGDNPINRVDPLGLAAIATDKILASSIKAEVHVDVAGNTPDSDLKALDSKKALGNAELAFKLLDWVNLGLAGTLKDSKTAAVAGLVQEYLNQEVGGDAGTLPSAVEIEKQLEDLLNADTANGLVHVFTRISYKTGCDAGKLKDQTDPWQEYKGGAQTDDDGGGLYGNVPDAWKDGKIIADYAIAQFKKAHANDLVTE